MALNYEISDMCKKCIKDHIELKGQFKIKCTPVPKELMDATDPYYPLEKIIGKEEYELLDERTKLEIQLSKNKLMWAKEFLSWSTYNKERDYDQFYQREMLCCNAKLRTMRLGRRMGKCNSYDSIIITANRGPITFEELNEKDTIISFDIQTGELIQENNFIKLDNGEKETIEITLRSGKQDTVTLNHPYLVLNNGKLDWKESGELKIGERVAVPKGYIGTFDNYETHKTDVDLYKELGNSNDEIPEIIFTSSKDNIKAYINAVFKNDEKYFSISKKKIIGLKHLLLRLGIHSKYEEYGNGYQLLISQNKHDKFENLCKNDELNFILNSDIVFEEIKEIKNTGIKKTYSISVPKNRTFITNDIITHNTEVVTVDSLHFAQTNPGKTVMIIGPFQNLIDEIFDRLASLLDGDESAFSGGYERKRQPNVIRLPNGSQIKGFTTGQNGDSIRGQSADRIYFDEAAYIPPTAFRSVLALLMDNPSVSITATSTPSALETNFKKWCLTDQDWRGFHYQSTLFPYFHEIEQTLRSTYTGDDYALEVLAEFIEGSSRIFKSHNVASAIHDYKYVHKFSETGLNRKDWIITCGVDWNEFRNGFQLVVLGFNKNDTTGRPFRVFNRISLHNETVGEDKLKNLQTLGVETIKEMYHNFQCDYVYVDQGHGSMQNEILSAYFHKIGRLHVFKGVDFSGNYEFEDVYTGEIKKKRNKVMMVYFLQKRFELGEIMISKPEESEKGLMINQLNEYRIDRYDSKDQPIFAGTDHILDALMLANFAIIENYSTLFDRKTGLYVGVIKRDETESFVKAEKNENKVAEKMKKVAEAIQSKPECSLSNIKLNVATISKNRKKRGVSFNEFELF
jgi:hypothetical protein